MDTLLDLWHKFSEWGNAFVYDYGLMGLGIFSFTEGFINPIPVGPVLGVAVATFGLGLVSAFLVTLITNILGASIGYYLGYKLGHPVCIKLFGKKRIDHAEKFFQKWGEWGIIIAAFTPIPFKVAAWSAGIFEMNYWKFLIASIIGRTAHFAVIVAVFYFGVEALKFLS